MESIRIGSKSVRIEVNDDGYCIELKLASDAWVKGLLDFSRYAQDRAKAHGDVMSQTDDLDVKIEHVIAFDQEIKDAFEKLFGAGSYEETFNSDLVGVEYVVEFLDAIMPYVEKRLDQRTKALDKYSPDKMGGAR